MELKFSQDIEALLKDLAERPLTLREILQETSEKGFSLGIGLLVLPFLFPMPPGLSGILASGSFLLAMQMALGMRKPWLPKKIANSKFPRQFALTLLKNLTRFTRRIENLVHPRWSWIAKSRKVWRVNGLCLAWLSFLLALPIPFTNPIPTIGMLLLVIATLEGDGLLMFVTYIFTTLVTLLFGIISYLLWKSPELLPNFFQ